ncbi:hypothetical protein D3C85_904500 [compost metagenome]
MGGAEPHRVVHRPVQPDLVGRGVARGLGVGVAAREGQIEILDEGVVLQQGHGQFNVGFARVLRSLGDAGARQAPTVVRQRHVAGRVVDLVTTNMETQSQTQRPRRQFKQIAADRAFHIGLFVQGVARFRIEQEGAFFRRQIAAQDARIGEIHVDALTAADRQVGAHAAFPLEVGRRHGVVQDHIRRIVAVGTAVLGEDVPLPRVGEEVQITPQPSHAADVVDTLRLVEVVRDGRRAQVVVAGETVDRVPAGPHAGRRIGIVPELAIAVGSAFATVQQELAVDLHAAPDLIGAVDEGRIAFHLGHDRLFAREGMAGVDHGA